MKMEYEKKIPQLWYENEEGVRWLPGLDDHEPPPEFKYQRSRFATHVTDNVLKLNEDGTSTRLITGSQGYPGDLMIALARPSLIERLKVFFRTGEWIKPMKVDQAILTAATACEGCMNVLAYERCLDWGYERNSPEHERVGTSCDLCKPEYVKYAKH